MPSSKEGITRLRLQTITQAVSGITAARVKLGIFDQSPTAADLFANLYTAGPYIVILPATMPALDGDSNLGSMSIIVRFYFGLAADVSNDFIDIEDIVYSLRDALATVANYTDCNKPNFMTVRLPDIDANLKPIIGKYEFELSFPVCV